MSGAERPVDGWTYFARICLRPRLKLHCGPDELITRHATLLQLDKEFRELRATSELDEAKLAELHSMVHRLIGLARGLGAVSRPDVQQPGRGFMRWFLGNGNG